MLSYNVSKSLTVSSWNVNGLFRRVNGQRTSKLEDKLFLKNLSSDIIALNETHACHNDIIQLENYYCFSKCRSKNPSRLRGGVSILIKSSIRKGVKIFDSSGTDIIWLRLCKEYFNFEKDMYICALYISPSNSTYLQRTDKDVFNTLENDIIKFSRKGTIMLLGDLNAHISNADFDFVVGDSVDVMHDFLPVNYNLDNMHLTRNTETKQVTNEYGKNILDLCISSQLRILNGRTVGDSRGRATFHGFNGSSIVDYCICSSELLKDVLFFKVNEFDGIFSDHNQITVSIQSYFCYQDNKCQRHGPRTLKWNESQKQVFTNNILHLDKSIISNNISSIIQNNDLSDNDKVDKLISDFSSVLHKASNISPAKNVKSKRKRIIKKKPWFDNDCLVLFRHVRYLGKQVANNIWDKSLRLKFYSENKKYKRAIKKKHKLFKSNIFKQLLESEKNNPKDFWNTVNSLMDKFKTDPSADISQDEWASYFKKLLNNSKNVDINNEIDNNTLYNFENNGLNNYIKEVEILKAVKSLKSGKSCGIDQISNEMLQLSCHTFIKEYTSIFNFILRNGIYPNIWKENIIKPIYKGGGNLNPSNYRGIALSSCFSKLFNRVLFNRLDDFIENNNILCYEQIGFKKSCRTSDHVLTLKTLIDKAFKSCKYLYVCFIDLSKAFDTVNRAHLFHKLKMYNINGLFLNIIKDMYNGLICSVKTREGLSENFTTNVGVKQGCILSPTLFSLYLNDLCKSFDSSCDKVVLGDSEISCLMYADDIVLLSNSSAGLQNLLNKFNSFCVRWDLTVNIDKTKIIIFNKSGKVLKNYKFMYNECKIELVNEYKYLGIIFKPSGTFSHAIKYLCNKANKAAFCIRKALFSDKMNVQLYLKLYENCVKPILLYCSEIFSIDNLIPWKDKLECRYENFIPEKNQLKLCKSLLGVHRSATNNAVRAELGMFPLAIFGLKQSVSFWLHVLHSSKNSLVYKAYTESINFHKGFGNNLKILLEYLNFNHVWQNQGTFSDKRLIYAIFSKLKTQYESYWKISINRNESSNKLRTYCNLKDNFRCEGYLLKNGLDKVKVSPFIRLRISAHKLYIEEGRYKKIPFDQRICPLCNVEVESEYHFLMSCASFTSLRQLFFKELNDIVPSFLQMNDTCKFKFILASKDYDLNDACINFVNDLFELRNKLMLRTT